MIRSPQVIGSLQSAIFTVLLVCLADLAMAQDRFDVAVVSDGDSNRLAVLQQKFVDELQTLTENEFDLRIKRFSGNWTKSSIEQALRQAYSDPDVDLVMVTGFVANQLTATRADYPKPTFLPLILDVNLVGKTIDDTTSGIPNLNYLSTYANFAEDLDTLSRIVPFRNLVLFVDEELASAIPQLRKAAFDLSVARGIDLTMVTHDGADHQLVNRVPAGTDAIFVAGLPRMPHEGFQALIGAINQAGLPSYSFVGVSDVERGLLVTNSEPRDNDRQARLNALNMQAVMLGGQASEQPVSTNIRQQLTINMDTARLIGLSPSFDVLGDAVILNRESKIGGQEYSLADIAREALDNNPDLLAESFGVEAGLQEIVLARANLLPQLGASSSYTLRRDSPSVSAGLLAERSTDAAISVDQLLYSDAASANLKIQKELQKTRLASLQQFRLDVVQAATTSYYTVLNARSQLSVQENNLKISRANLELAETRVRLGTSSSADIYRWQAEVAGAQILVLNARATLNQSWDTLNRVLHRPQGTRIALREATFDEPFVMKQAEFDELVRNQADYARFSLFYIDRSLRQAPELEQLNAQITAKRRELVSQRRAYWLPDFSVGGRYTSNLEQSGIGAGSSAGQDLNDWSVGVQATLPLFSGGLKKANVSRASYELRQLEALYTSTADRVEEQTRLQLHAAQASYGQIDLATTAANASRKNFELVSDAYARGAVSIIDLLDAQDSSIAADATAAESLYNFLINIMALQRAIGGYDFLLSDKERGELADLFRSTLTGPAQ